MQFKMRRKMAAIFIYFYRALTVGNVLCLCVCVCWQRFMFVCMFVHLCSQFDPIFTKFDRSRSRSRITQSQI